LLGLTTKAVVQIHFSFIIIFATLLGILESRWWKNFKGWGFCAVYFNFSPGNNFLPDIVFRCGCEVAIENEIAEN